VPGRLINATLEGYTSLRIAVLGLLIDFLPSREYNPIETYAQKITFHDRDFVRLWNVYEAYES
jgi:hypothetical protein